MHLTKTALIAIVIFFASTFFAGPSNITENDASAALAEGPDSLSNITTLNDESPFSNSATPITPGPATPPNDAPKDVWQAGHKLVSTPGRNYEVLLCSRGYNRCQGKCDGDGDGEYIRGERTQVCASE